jgi:dTDP-4-amino-4,6-dideoxygalactose transaminase
VHQQPPYADFLAPAGAAAAEAAVREILSLPIYPQLSPEAAGHVAAAIADRQPARVAP